MARVMRARSVKVNAGQPVIDTCGTGGDAAGTFNISTAAALVAAGAGLNVAKHGNRAMSSRCGSADVLGVRIDCDAAGVERCIREAGIGFMFAPLFHPAMKYAAAPRREIGIRTVFNLIGPLTNPAGAQAQVIGVAEGTVAEKIALALRGLGCRHALVLYSEKGIDEIAVSGRTRIHELTDDEVKSYTVTPADFGLAEVDLKSMRGGDAAENADILRDVLSGAVAGPRRDVVLMNAAAALLAGDKVDDLRQGFELAAEVIDNGQVMAKLEKLVEVSNR
jgi:anthranilate phosphoribosyltransferase